MDFPYYLHAVKMFPFFFFGALYGASDRLKAWVNGNGWVYALAFAAYFALQLSGFRISIVKLTGFPAIVILMTLFSKYDHRIPRLLTTIGQYSLEIYVFHWFMLPTLPWLLPLLTQRSSGVQLYNVNIAPLLVITLVLAAVIVAACMAVGVAVRHNRALSIILFGGGAGQSKQAN